VQFRLRMLGSSSEGNCAILQWATRPDDRLRFWPEHTERGLRRSGSSGVISPVSS